MAIFMWIANDMKICKVLNTKEKKQLDVPDIHYPVKLSFNIYNLNVFQTKKGKWKSLY